MKSLIIGKHSNLSKKLAEVLKDTVLISSRDILQDISILSPYRNENIQLIFNNFQPAVKLGDITDSVAYIENSILSTSKVLDFFKASNITKVIYTSSSSVYGNNIFCNESDLVKPMNLHASLKVSNEKLVEMFCKKYNIDYTIARNFNMYGGEDNFSVISKIINAYKQKKTLTIVNNGNAIRDFIHVDDVVDAYVKILELKNINIVNVGTGKGVSIKNILDFLRINGYELKTKNINIDELTTSTANSTILCEKIGKNDFIEIEGYLKKALLI